MRFAFAGGDKVCWLTGQHEPLRSETLLQMIRIAWLQTWAAMPAANLSLKRPINRILSCYQTEESFAPAQKVPGALDTSCTADGGCKGADTRSSRRGTGRPCRRTPQANRPSPREQALGHIGGHYPLCRPTCCVISGRSGFSPAATFHQLLCRCRVSGAGGKFVRSS